MVEQNAPTDSLELHLGARENIRIDGVTYDLMPLDGLSPRVTALMQRNVDRINVIEQMGEDASEDDDREYEDRMRALAHIAIPTAPAEILGRLGLGQLKAVTLTFFDRGANSPEYLATRRILRRRLPTLLPTSPASTAPENGS